MIITCNIQKYMCVIMRYVSIQYFTCIRKMKKVIYSFSFSESQGFLVFFYFKNLGFDRHGNTLGLMT